MKFSRTHQVLSTLLLGGVFAVVSTQAAAFGSGGFGKFSGGGARTAASGASGKAMTMIGGLQGQGSVKTIGGFTVQSGGSTGTFTVTGPKGNTFTGTPSGTGTVAWTVTSAEGVVMKSGVAGGGAMKAQVAAFKAEGTGAAAIQAYAASLGAVAP
jgi:hypothetical protein